MKLNDLNIPSILEEKMHYVMDLREGPLDDIAKEFGGYIDGDKTEKPAAEPEAPQQAQPEQKPIHSGRVISDIQLRQLIMHIVQRMYAKKIGGEMKKSTYRDPTMTDVKAKTSQATDKAKEIGGNLARKAGAISRSGDDSTFGQRLRGAASELFR